MTEQKNNEENEMTDFERKMLELLEREVAALETIAEVAKGTVRLPSPPRTESRRGPFGSRSGGVTHNDAERREED